MKKTSVKVTRKDPPSSRNKNIGAATKTSVLPDVKNFQPRKNYEEGKGKWKSETYVPPRGKVDKEEVLPDMEEVLEPLGFGKMMDKFFKSLKEAKDNNPNFKNFSFNKDLKEDLLKTVPEMSQMNRALLDAIIKEPDPYRKSLIIKAYNTINSPLEPGNSFEDFDMDMLWRSSVVEEASVRLAETSPNYKGEPKSQEEIEKMEMSMSAEVISTHASRFTDEQFRMWLGLYGEEEGGKIVKTYLMYASWENLDAIVDIAMDGVNIQNKRFLLDNGAFNTANLDKLNDYNRKFLKIIGEKILERSDRLEELDISMYVNGKEDEDDEEYEYGNRNPYIPKIGAPFGGAINYIKKKAWLVTAVVIVSIANMSPISYSGTLNAGSQETVTKDYARELYQELKGSTEGFNETGDIFKHVESITKNTIHPYYHDTKYSVEDGIVDSMYSWIQILDELTEGKFTVDAELFFHLDRKVKENGPYSTISEYRINEHGEEKHFDEKSMKLLASEHSIVDYGKELRTINRLASSSTHLSFKRGSEYVIGEGSSSNMTLAIRLEDEKGILRYADKWAAFSFMLKAGVDVNKYVRPALRTFYSNPLDINRRESLTFDAFSVLLTLGSEVGTGLLGSVSMNTMLDYYYNQGKGENNQFLLERPETTSVPGVIEIRPGVYKYSFLGKNINVFEKSVLDLEKGEFINNINMVRKSFDRLISKEIINMTASGYGISNPDYRNQALLFTLQKSKLNPDFSSEHHPFAPITSNLNAWKSDDGIIASGKSEIMERTMSIIQCAIALDDYSFTSVKLYKFAGKTLGDTFEKLNATTPLAGGFLEEILKEAKYYSGWTSFFEGTIYKKSFDFKEGLSHYTGIWTLLITTIVREYALLTLLTRIIDAIPIPSMERYESYLSFNGFSNLAYGISRTSVKLLSRFWSVGASAAAFSLTANTFITLAFVPAVEAYLYYASGKLLLSVLFSMGGLIISGYSYYKTFSDVVVDALYLRRNTTIEVGKMVVSNFPKVMQAFSHIWNPTKSIFGSENIGDGTVRSLEKRIMDIVAYKEKTEEDLVNEINAWLQERGLPKDGYGKAKDYINRLYKPTPNDPYELLSDFSRDNRNVLREATMFISMLVIAEVGLSEEGYIKIDPSFSRGVVKNGVRDWIGQIWYKEEKMKNTFFLKELIGSSDIGQMYPWENIYYNEQSIDFLKLLSFDSSKAVKKAAWMSLAAYLAITVAVETTYGWGNLLPNPTLEFMKTEGLSKYEPIMTPGPNELALSPLAEGTYYLYPDYLKKPEKSMEDLVEVILKGIDDPDAYFEALESRLAISRVELSRKKMKEGQYTGERSFSTDNDITKALLNEFIGDYKMMYLSMDPDLKDIPRDVPFMTLDDRVHKKLKFKEKVRLESMDRITNVEGLRSKIVKYENYVITRRNIAINEFIAKRRDEPGWEPASMDYLFYFDEGLISYAFAEMAKIDIPEFFRGVDNRDNTKKLAIMEKKLEAYLDMNIEDKDKFWKEFGGEGLFKFQSGVLFRYYGEKGEGGKI